MAAMTAKTPGAGAEGGTPGRVAVITGGAGGLGRVMATALVNAGHKVCALDVSEAALAALREHPPLAANPAALHTVCGNVAQEADCNRAVAEANARLGGVQILINNAGLGPSSLRPDAERNPPGIEELTPEIWERYWGVNVRGAIQMTRAALPSMRAGGWGRIVNNTTSFRTMLRILPYGAVKAAFESITAVWAQELASTGITANVLVPGGPTDTGFISDDAGWDRAKMLRPDIMGPPTAWLASAAADGFTGQRITAGLWREGSAPAAQPEGAVTPIGWPDLGKTSIWPT